MRRLVAILLALALPSVLAACGDAAVNKQGAPAPAVIGLRVGAVNPDDPALTYFVGAVDRLSDHRLRVEVDPSTYQSETPGGEARLAADTRAGTVDLMYLPARDWVTATGDPAFRALQSPFLVSTTAGAVSFSTSSVATAMLAGAASDGVVGLGLVPSEARRLMTAEPVLGAADLAGRRIRINDSAQAASLFTALGAKPRQGLDAGATRDQLGGGSLDGVETAPKYAVPNAYQVNAPYLSSFGLFPHIQFLAAGAGVWGRLGAPDQKALRAAASATLAAAAVDVPHREAAELAQLCTNGMVVVRPGAGAFRALVARAGLLEGPDAERIRSVVPDAGPQQDASPAPDSCRVATTAAGARALHRKPPATPAPAPSGSVTIPAGTYRFTVTAKQWAAGGQIGRDWASDITFRQTFRPDGTFSETQEPDFPDQGPLSGKYAVHGDTVVFTFDPSPTGNLAQETVRWSYFQGLLTFTLVDVQDSASRIIYAQPWRKVS